MADLSAASEAVLARLEAKHQAREATLDASRRCVRRAANAIRAAHRGDHPAAADLLDEAAAALQGARRACAEHPEVGHAGFVHDAEKEYAEARTTVALVQGTGRLPGPEELGVSDVAWLNGLAETVGELRRHLLDLLRGGQLERCEALLSDMDDIYALLVTVDYPDGVTAGLRRSTDVARSILERTRGDLTVALVQERLHEALDRHRQAVVGGGR